MAENHVIEGGELVQALITMHEGNRPSQGIPVL